LAQGFCSWSSSINEPCAPPIGADAAASAAMRLVRVTTAAFIAASPPHQSTAQEESAGATVSGTAAWVACPPPGAPGCIVEVQREDPRAWHLRASFDKGLAQRSFELLVVYDWLPPQAHAERQQVVRASGVLEAMRQLVCAAAFARCDAALPGRACNAALPWGSSAGTAVTALANVAFELCNRHTIEMSPTLGPGSDMDKLGACFRAAVAWAEAEYVWAVQPFVAATGVQPDDKLDESNSRKVRDIGLYPVLSYPPSLSPGGVCALGASLFPLFGGEAFGDTAWVDVTNQRTRHLAMVSLLELLENGAGFAERHPAGLSHVAVNLGAGDGICRSGHSYDPANCLFATGFGGVLVEANAALRPGILQRLSHRQPDLRLVLEAVAPDTVSSMLETELARRPGPPVGRDEVDIIKIDVDGADCELAAALAAADWRPKVWHVEVNPLFPPGVAVRQRDVRAASSRAGAPLGSAFTRRPSPLPLGGADDGRWRVQRRIFTGCSLQVLLDMFGDSYALLQVEFENAVLVRRDLSGALEPWLSASDDMAKWRIGYFCHPLARLRLPHDNDEDSPFLKYDFRLWGDLTLEMQALRLAVEAFLAEFYEPDSYSMGSDSGGSQVSTTGIAEVSDRALLAEGAATKISVDGEETLVGGPPPPPEPEDGADDPECNRPWKGHVLEWPSVLANVERLLSAWAGGGDVEGLLAVLTEGIASALNIDHAWPIFKSVMRAECPLGGIAVVAVLRWRCGSDTWEKDKRAPATARLFFSMLRQLPMLLDEPAEPRDWPWSQAGNPAALGCDAVLERYLETALRRLGLSVALRSRWPIFELLSALHTENRAWPRGYP